MNNGHSRDSGRETAGLIIVAIGVALLLNSMGMFPLGGLLARYWLPTLLMAIGAAQWSRTQGREGRFVGLFFSALACWCSPTSWACSACLGSSCGSSSRPEF